MTAARDDAVTVHTPPAVDAQTLPSLARLLQVANPPHVVDIGANPLEDTPPYLPLLRAGLITVTGFEPQPDAMERLRAQAGPNERYLPHAVGDGTPRELSLCVSPGFSSLLVPDEAQLAVLTDFPELARVMATETIPTTRLDDLATRGDLDPVDLLKVDAQGSEPLILEHGRHALRDVLAVQIEVAFHRLYAGGPVIGELDLQLRTFGLVPHAFVSTRTWPLAPLPWADPLQSSARHLVEADLLYVRDPATWRDLPTERLRALILLLVGAYGEVGTGAVLLHELVRRGDADPETSAEYRRLLG